MFQVFLLFAVMLFCAPFSLSRHLGPPPRMNRAITPFILNPYGQLLHEIMFNLMIFLLP